MKCIESPKSGPLVPSFSWQLKAFLVMSATTTLIVALTCPSAVSAATFAIQDATGPNNNSSTTNRTLGWIFSVNQSMTVQELGIWDLGANGLAQSHPVAIWTNTGTLLGSTTVQSGTASPLAGPSISGGHFRFEPVSPIALLAGQRYVVGALFNDNDEFVYEASSLTTAPEITFIDERFSDSNSGFVFPIESAVRRGLFGPSFTFVAVPEPATVALLGFALAAMAARRFRD